MSDKVEPAAVTVIGPEPSKSTPLIALGVARVVASAAKVAVAALPVVFKSDATTKSMFPLASSYVTAMFVLVPPVATKGPAISCTASVLN